jgi:hypothetical protein
MGTPGSRGSITLSQKLRYRFDNMMARGASGQFILLGLFSLLIAVVIIALTMVALMAFGAREGDTLIEVLTRTVLLILVPDPVDFNEDGVLMFTSGVVAIIGGLFAGGVLIGILTAAIEDRMEELRRGRSFVAERHHTVILGWSSKMLRIVDELCIANEEIADSSRASRCITILADRDKVEMEEVALRPVSEYVTPGQPTSFYPVAEAALRRRHIAVGYTDRGAVVTNPVRSARRSFDSTDRLIVVRGSSGI